MVADPGLVKLLEMIEQYGWAVQYVMAGDQPGDVEFAYTVGLTTLGHPEVVIQGLPPDSAKTYLNIVGRGVRDGSRFEPGLITTDLPGLPVRCAFIAVEDSSELVAIEQIYDEVEAVQFVWPDSADHLPWEPGWRNPPGCQPLLGRMPGRWHTR